RASICGTTCRGGGPTLAFFRSCTSTTSITAGRSRSNGWNWPERGDRSSRPTICRSLQICGSGDWDPSELGFVSQLEPERRRVFGDGHDRGRGSARLLHQTRFLVDARRYRLHVPGEPNGGHQADDVPGRIELPPVETVARRALIAVMVVV